MAFTQDNKTVFNNYKTINFNEMKQFIYFLSILFSSLALGQFTSNDVKFYVGEGSQTSYLIVDFKDGTDDRSYAWGFRYEEGQNITFGQMLQAIEEAEPNFSHLTGSNGGFLNDIIFNAHQGLEGDPDWWSTWSGETAETMSMNAGISEPLQNERWYGTSYGFMNPSPEHPVTPIPAYSSLWFSESDIDTWIGEGQNRSILIVDFGTDTEGVANSFAFGIQYEEETITVEEALTRISNRVENFEFSLTEDQISSITFNEFEGISSEDNPWKTFIGTDLSNWVTENSIATSNLENGKWAGFSFGERRPFIPTDEVILLNTADVELTKSQLYPNPTSTVFYVNDLSIDKVSIFDLTGKLVLTTSNTKNGISVQGLEKGVYIVTTQFQNKVSTYRLIVQ